MAKRVPGEPAGDAIFHFAVVIVSITRLRNIHSEPLQNNIQPVTEGASRQKNALSLWRKYERPLGRITGFNAASLKLVEHNLRQGDGPIAGVTFRRAFDAQADRSPVRRRGNTLERWEIGLIKAMIADGRWPNDQDILAHFTRPTRSVNHRAIAEIRTGTKHTLVKSAAPEDLDAFLGSWPDVDPETGLSLQGDELLIKAREAMIAAVHIFNGAGLTFRTELFIVTAVIAWTYLLHAWFKREGIDYRHTKTDAGQRVVLKTPNGADKYWELAQCLKHPRCPVERGAADNLLYLLDLRHEIEHRSTSRLDDAVSAKLQACCINFTV